MLAYEQEFERGVTAMCEVASSFIVQFAALAKEILFEYEKAKIVVPLSEYNNIIAYFKQNGFTITQLTPTWVRVSM